MSKDSIKSHFSFNKQERNGIFFLLLTIVVLQVSYYFTSTFMFAPNPSHLEMDEAFQSKIDQLKLESAQRDSVVVYDFNPNFITDYRGYVLGMSTEEIDRLHHFRANNNYVNSAQEFQEVTLVSDSLLNVLSPSFKFPAWTQKPRPVPKKGSGNDEDAGASSLVVGIGNLHQGDEQLKDLNSATATELKAVVGVGEVLSNRIVKFRDRLGGFVVNEQLGHVYGLEGVVVDRILERFTIFSPPKIIKVNINDAAVSELVELVYIDYKMANGIVAYRELNGVITSFDELLNIEGFPSEKIDIIQLYLQL